MEEESKKGEKTEKGISFKELREKLDMILRQLEKQVLSEKQIDSSQALYYIKEIDHALTKSGEIRSVSESSIVERYAITYAAIKGIALVKVCCSLPEVEKELHRIKEERATEIISRNISVCSGSIGLSKGILIESLFAGILQKEETSTKKVELFCIMKQKAHTKQRVTGKEDFLTQYMIKKATYIIKESIERLLPVTKDTSKESFCEIIRAVTETESHLFLSQLVLSQTNSSSSSIYAKINVRTILHQLSAYETEPDPKEKEENMGIYCLHFDAAARYISIKKREKRSVTGREVLECIFSEEEIELMLSLLERDLPPLVQSKILNVLVEGEVVLHRKNVSLTSYTFPALVRYVAMHGFEAEPVLFDIVNGLETDFSFEDEEEKDKGFEEILVLDFFNDTLDRYVQKQVDASSSIQKYIADFVLDLYNGLVCSVNCPLLTFGYLKMLYTLVHDGKTHSSCFSSLMQRNLVLSKCIGGISAAVKQMSIYYLQEEYLYVERSAVERANSEEVRSSETIRQTTSFLLQIILLLSSQMKITVSSIHLLNIIFRAIAEERCISADVLVFVQDLFSCPGVVQKLSSSAESRFFLLLATLINGGEISAAEKILEKNQRIYSGFFLHKVVSLETVQQKREDPALYSLLSALMVYYYADRAKNRNREVENTIKKIFNEVVRVLSGQMHIVSSLVETPEFTSFFKASSLVSTSLSLDTEGFLYLLLKTEPCSAEIDIKKPHVSILYKCKSKNIAECFFFHQFVSKNEKKVLPSSEEEAGRFILSEVCNPFTGAALKYIALLGLSGENVPHNSVFAKSFSEIDFSELSEVERVLFTNQIYRALFLTGSVQEGRSLKNTGSSSKKRDSAFSGIDNAPTAYSYADMCIRSAITVTETTKIPYPVSAAVLAEGTPFLVSALLYTLYEVSPYSPVILSYIEKMKKFVKEDDSIFSDVLFSVVQR